MLMSVPPSRPRLNSALHHSHFHYRSPYPVLDDEARLVAPGCSGRRLCVSPFLTKPNLSDTQYIWRLLLHRVGSDPDAPRNLPRSAEDGGNEPHPDRWWPTTQAGPF
jgi:hypothetical protein